MRKPTVKLKMIIISAAVLCVGIIAMVMYLNRLGIMIEEITVSNLKQLAEHDLNSIEVQTSNIWDNLSGIYIRVLDEDIQSIVEVCSRLNKETSPSLFDEVLLVDEDGNSYSSTGVIKSSADSGIVQQLLSGKDKAVKGEIKGSSSANRKETVAYAVRGKEVTVEGVKMIGIVCFTPVKYLEQHLNIKSYNGEGLSSVFEENGDFIINPDRSLGMRNQDNHFDGLRNSYGYTDEMIDGLKERILTGDEVIDIREIGEYGTRIIYYKKMESTGWFFCSSIPESVISSYTQPFIMLTAIVMTFVVLLILALTLLIACAAVLKVSADSKAKAHSDFLSAMSHEMRTPLNAIIGFNELMQKRFDDTEKTKEYLKKSDATAKYMLSLINDVLDMSKIRAGKMDIESNPFSVSQSVATMTAITQAHMDEKNISFDVSSDIIADTLIGDETHMEQIILNILSNAAKFTPEGGTVTMNISQSVPQEGSVTTVFEVADNGIGMSDEFQKQIFDEFSQERTATNSSIKGTGLGMALSRMYAVAMGGDLTVKSTLGIGSVFRFTVTNAVCDSSKVLGVGDAGDENGSDNMCSINVLIAEDNELNAEILTDMLELENISTKVATDGSQAVRMFSESKPNEFDVILMDIMMPEMDGYEATRAIREMERPDAKSVIIFACSANTSSEDKEKAYSCGMNDYITKPIDTAKLITKLKRIEGRS